MALLTMKMKITKMINDDDDEETGKCSILPVRL